MWTILLGFITKNWKEVLVGLAVLLFVGYIMTLRNMVDYYKDKSQKLERIVASLMVRTKELEGAATEISRKYELRGSAIYKADEQRAMKVAERIANDKITRTIRLPNIAVQLFNSTEAKPEGGSTSTAQQGNASGTNSAQAPAVNPEGMSDKTLNDLLAVANENKLNHEKAVKQVKEWQSFWADYVRSVEKADSEAPIPEQKKRFGIF